MYDHQAGLSGGLEHPANRLYGRASEAHVITHKRSVAARRAEIILHVDDQKRCCFDLKTEGGHFGSDRYHAAPPGCMQRSVQARFRRVTMQYSQTLGAEFVRAA